jgi:hypothetical protein
MSVRTFAAGAVWILGGGAMLAQEVGHAPLAARRFDVRPAAGEIRIDGLLDDAGWQGAATWDLPYEWSPGDNVPPPVRTEFFVTYDDRNLYVAWRCHDPEPARIRANFMDRDSINTFVQDDHVVLMIDPFNDERRGWQFRINPLGVQADAIFSENEGIEDFSFDLIWSSAATIDDGGWSVEAAIPFSQLRFPRGDAPQTWGFDVGRSYPRVVRHRIVSWPRDRGRNCVLCQVDKVSGFRGMTPGRNLEIVPTATALRTDRRADLPTGPLASGDVDRDFGLTAKWGITSDLTLSATLNPDFSQVEADAAQLAVNQRFALFFPEKRPFFLEGIDFFSTPIDAVFSRTVVDPEWGVKLSGKMNGNALGVFATRDDVNSLLIPSNQFSIPVFLDEPVTSGVARYRRDIGGNSTVGLLYAGRDGDEYHNRVGGIDGFVRLRRNHTLRLQALRSDTRYPDDVAARFDQPAEAFSGAALFASYSYQSRNWLGSVAWEDREPGFRADSGFVPRVDMVQLRGGLERVFWGEDDDWYDRLGVGLATRRTEDQAGRLSDDVVDLYASYQGPLQSFVQVSFEKRRDSLAGVRFDDIYRQEIYAEFQPSGAIKATFYGDFGDEVDVANVRAARIFELSPGVEAKLGRHVNLQLSHTLRKLHSSGGEIFEANLSQLRAVYNFNTRALVRVILQYLDLERNPDLHIEPVAARTERLFSQLLFSYKVNPQTLLFVGYSDNSLSGDTFSLTRADRTFFFKLGYAFLL